MAAAMALYLCVFNADCAECPEKIHRELGRRCPDERARDRGRASGMHSSVNFFFHLFIFYVIMDAAILSSFAPLCIKLTVDSNVLWFRT